MFILGEVILNRLTLLTKKILSTTQGCLLALLTLVVIMCLFLRASIFNVRFHDALFLRHNVSIHTYDYLNDEIDHLARYASDNTSDPFLDDLLKIIKSSISLRFTTLNLDLIRSELFSYLTGEREFLPDISFPNISSADVEKFSKNIPSSNFKTLKKINLSTILVTFGLNDVVTSLFRVKFIFFLIHHIPVYLFMIVLTIFFLNLLFMKNAHSMCILGRRYLISLGVLSILLLNFISIGLYYLVSNKLFIQNVPPYFSSMISNYTINAILPIIIMLALLAILSFVCALSLKKIKSLLRCTQNISFISKFDNKHFYLLYPVMFMIIVVCLVYKLNSIYTLAMANFKNILSPKEAVVAAQDDTIYDIKVTLLDAKTKIPIPGISVSMSGISKDGVYFNSIAKSNSDGSLKFSANKGHFYLDFVCDLFPPEYLLPKRRRINFDTAKTINVSINLQHATYTKQNGFGTVSLELLDIKNNPHPNISLCLTSSTDDSKKIYSVSNSKGVSVFNAKAGSYVITVLEDNFPSDKYHLPDKFDVSIKAGLNKTYTMKLVSK